ncbi:MAG: CtsR family transcriptional regulator [Bacillota bacterium]|nr:transcriptional regulator [Bacillota bacterium]REJ35719.1 MAG: transcriptional regulator [Bacillota bacterium]
MSSLSDRIEAYLMHLLLHSQDGCIEVRRAEVADRFACVPSQVTYVLATRFTPERGFYVESRRGGGGYIRIVARHPRPEASGLQAVWQRIGRSLTSGQAEGLLRSLEQGGLLTRRQAALMRQALRQEADWAEPPLCDLLRAAVIKGMLLMLSSSPDGRDRIG